MTHSITSNSPYLILEVKNLFSEIDNKRILADVLTQMEKEINQCIVDISKIDIMNSIGLNFLIAVLRNAKQKGGDMTVVNPSKQVLKLLEVTKLASIINISPSIQDATTEL